MTIEQIGKVIIVNEVIYAEHKWFYIGKMKIKPGHFFFLKKKKSSQLSPKSERPKVKGAWTPHNQKPWLPPF